MKIFASKYEEGSEYDYKIIDFAGLRLTDKPFKHIAINSTEKTIEILKNIFDWVFQNTNSEKYVYIDMGEIIVWDGKFNIKKVLFTLIDSAKRNNKFDKLEILDNNFALKSKDFSKIPYRGIDYMLGYRRDDDESNNPVEIKDRKLEKHFICLNKRPHQHRLDIVEWINNCGFSDKFYYSLSEVEDGHPMKKILDLNFHNRHQFHHLSAGIIPQNYTSFCNIITESRVETDFIEETPWLRDNFEFENIPMIHLTEKTAKCLVSKQPFIMIGGAYYLKYMKKLGFKTFDKWWDESYDTETDYQIRLSKIKDILTEISTWSIDKCKDVLVEMEDVLEYNYAKSVEINEKYSDYRRLVEVFFRIPNQEEYTSHFETL